MRSSFVFKSFALPAALALSTLSTLPGNLDKSTADKTITKAISTSPLEPVARSIEVCYKSGVFVGLSGRVQEDYILVVPNDRKQYSLSSTYDGVVLGCYQANGELKVNNQNCIPCKNIFTNIQIVGSSQVCYVGMNGTTPVIIGNKGFYSSGSFVLETISCGH
jgi:hypothetical protein